MDYFTFDFFIVYPAQCVGSYASRLLFTALLPLGLIGGVLLVSLVADLALKLRKRQRLSSTPAIRHHAPINATTSTERAGPSSPPRSPTRASNAPAPLSDKSNLVAAYGGPIALFIGFCSFAPISTFIFQVFDCRSFELDSQAGISQRYMHADLQIRCNDRYGGYASEEYSNLLGTAVGLILLWPVGFTIVCIALLVASRRNAGVTLERRTRLSHAARFIYQEYQPTIFWWEVLEIVRRLFLTSFVLGIPEEHALMRLVAGTLTCILYSCLLMLVRPYKRPSDNYIAISSNVRRARMCRLRACLRSPPPRAVPTLISLASRRGSSTW